MPERRSFATDAPTTSSAPRRSLGGALTTRTTLTHSGASMPEPSPRLLATPRDALAVLPPSMAGPPPGLAPIVCPPNRVTVVFRPVQGSAPRKASAPPAPPPASTARRGFWRALWRRSRQPTAAAAVQREPLDPHTAVSSSDSRTLPDDSSSGPYDSALSSTSAAASRRVRSFAQHASPRSGRYQIPYTPASSESTMSLRQRRATPGRACTSMFEASESEPGTPIAALSDSAAFRSQTRSEAAPLGSVDRARQIPGSDAHTVPSDLSEKLLPLPPSLLGGGWLSIDPRFDALVGSPTALPALGPPLQGASSSDSESWGR